MESFIETEAFVLNEDMVNDVCDFVEFMVKQMSSIEKAELNFYINVWYSCKEDNINFYDNVSDKVVNFIKNTGSVDMIENWEVIKKFLTLENLSQIVDKLSERGVFNPVALIRCKSLLH